MTTMALPGYIAPDTLAEVLRLKHTHGHDARVIAGGTDLILRMRDKVLSPGLLIDLRRTSLDHISTSPHEMSFGAYVTAAQILSHTGIATQFPALVEACRHFAGPPIRNRATLGGNLVNASPAADLVPPLMAYDASIILASTGGERKLKLREFFTGPGQTVMRPDELLTAVHLPLPSPNSQAAFIKLGQRRSMAIAIVSACAHVTLLAGNKIRDARIVLGAVAPTVVRTPAAEALLNGCQFDSDVIAAAARQAAEEVSPISDVRASRQYRKRMVEVLVRRALTANLNSLTGGDRDE